MNTRRHCGLGALAALSVIGLVACSSGGVNRGGAVGNGGGNGASAGNSGLAAAGGQSFGTGGSGTSGAGGIDACQAQTEPAVLTPVNMVFIIDKSGSMGSQWTPSPSTCTTNTDCALNNGSCVSGKCTCTTDANCNAGVTCAPTGVCSTGWDNLDLRWNPVRDAMTAFFQNPGTKGLDASLTYFPKGGQPTGAGTGVCDKTHYSTPDVPLESLDDPAAVQVLVASLNNVVPGGGTPTLAAVNGAIQYAQSSMAATPGSKSVVVLVTDGQPGVAAIENGVVVNEQCSCYGGLNCVGSDGAEVGKVAQAAKIAAAATPPVLTYVIGMGEVDPTSMNTIALEGGTQHAYIVDSSVNSNQTSTEFAAALSNIRTVRAPCNIQMPAPPTNETFDKLKVNVQFVTGTGTTQPLYYAGALASKLGGTQLTCPDPGPPAPSNPWYWTYDNEDNPTQIVLCPSACAQTAGDANGKVNIAYGCATNASIH